MQTRPPLGLKRSTQENPMTRDEFNAPAHEDVIPTIISQRNVSAPGAGISPTRPVDTPGALPVYEVASPARPEYAPRKGQKPPTRNAVALVMLAVIIVAASISVSI